MSTPRLHAAAEKLICRQSVIAATYDAGRFLWRLLSFAVSEEVTCLREFSDAFHYVYSSARPSKDMRGGAICLIVERR